MKNLIEISRIVTKRKVKKIEIFDELSLRHKNSKFNEFYDALRDNKYKNDREAASALYACNPTAAKYRQLKSRFRKRLLNTLFFLDINAPSVPNYEKGYYHCNREWAVIKILLSQNANNAAAYLASQLMTVSLKFCFSDLVVNCARILRDHAAATANERDYELYDNHIKQFSHVLEAEIRSEEFLQRVMMNYEKPVTKSHNLREKIDSYCEALVSLSEQYDSPVIFFNMYFVWIYRYEMLQDFEAMLEVCEQGELYLQNNPLFEQEDKKVFFQIKKMSAYLHLQNYRDGRANAEKSLKAFAEGSDNWFLFMEYYFLLAMHSENYIHAVAIFSTVVEHSKFKKMDVPNKEKWFIFEAYLHYLVESDGKQNKVLQMKSSSDFKVNRFLLETYANTKDEVIFNILLSVLQILFLLERRNLSGLSEKVERLKKLSTRLVRKEEYYRPVQFIRLLHQLHKVDFQLEEMTTLDKYLNALAERPFFYQGRASDLEVIPYEKLWRRIIAYFN